MNVAVVYFSRTGNTKRLAQAIAETAKAPIFDLASIQPSAISSFDLLILGSPVEGASPTKEAVSFIQGIPKVEGKKAILFCTNRLFGAGSTLKKMEKLISDKGYETVLCVSKKGMKPEKEVDFSDILKEIRKVL